MRTLLLTAVPLLAAIEARGKDVQLSAGMPRSTVVKVLRDIATDISSGLEVSAGPNGTPASEFCWELKDYDLVVWLYGAEDGRIRALGTWTKKDFRLPKGERYDIETTARSITLDTEKHTFTIEKFRRYFPNGSIEEYEQSWYAPLLFAMKEPVLSTVGKEKDYFAFRVLYLPGFSSRPGPAAVRYEKKGDRFFRRWVLLSDAAPGTISDQKAVEVKGNEVESLMASLERAGFWKLPRDDRVDAVSQLPGNDNTGIDRSRLIVEVIKDGEHRVRGRWSLDYKTEERGLSALVKLCGSQFEEAGFWKKDARSPAVDPDRVPRGNERIRK